MTATTSVPTPSAWQPRPEPQVLRDQLEGIAAWNAARRAAELRERLDEAAARSREDRLDLSRRLDVIRRQHQALIARTEQQIARTGALLRSRPAPRAVIAHRNDWFKDKLVAALAQGGVDVVARLDNGADAVGVCVAEQPDLLLVEDKLAMISGEEVVRQVLTFAPATVIAAQVSYDDGVAAMLEAGARTAFTRRVPPLDVARDLCVLVAA